VNKGRIRAFISRSDAAQSSSVSSIDAPLIQPLPTIREKVRAPRQKCNCSAKITAIVGGERAARHECRLHAAIKARGAALGVPHFASTDALFKSFFIGGFECSMHRRRDGKRLDLIAATGHDVNAKADYRILAEHGIRTVRDGLRWHLIETAPGRYDWSSFLPMLRAACDADTQVIGISLIGAGRTISTSGSRL
jgi:hypothetical protein